MVLIDSSHEDQARRLKDGSCRRGVLLRALRRQVRILGLRRLAAAAGLVRGLDDTTLAREVLPEFTGAARAVSLSTQHRRACVQEMCIIAQPSGPPPSLGSLPLTVLTAAGRDRAWMWLQDELASLSPDSEHIIAREAGHCLHLDEPQLVIETLLDLLTRIS